MYKSVTDTENALINQETVQKQLEDEIRAKKEVATKET